MDCKKWLKCFVIKNGPVTPKEVYAAGAEKGFTRKKIKAARRWYGKYIETETIAEKTFWRWSR